MLRLLRSTYAAGGASVGVAFSVWFAVISARYAAAQADLTRAAKQELTLHMLRLATGAVILGFILLLFVCLYSQSRWCVRLLGGTLMAVLCWVEWRWWSEIWSVAWAL